MSSGNEQRIYVAVYHCLLGSAFVQPKSDNGNKKHIQNQGHRCGPSSRNTGAAPLSLGPKITHSPYPRHPNNNQKINSKYTYIKLILTQITPTQSHSIQKATYQI